MRPRYFIITSLIILISLAWMNEAQARRGFALGIGPIGNIFIIDTTPIMDPGIGGYTFFQYRFAEQFAFQAGFLLTTQDGANTSSGDNGILFLGMPTLDLKFYFLTGAPRFDPFVSLGTGLYILTEGTTGNDTGGIGVGTNLGLGFDYYFTPSVSAGFEGVFRTIGIISDFGTPSSSSAIFPYSLMANVAFHF